MVSTAIPTAMRVPRFPGGGRIADADVAVPRPGPGELLLAVRAGRRALALTHAAIRSFQTGRRVEVS